MKISIIVTGTGVYPDGKLRTGLWLGEITHIYHSSKKCGYDIVAASPKGGDTPIDPLSLKPVFMDRLTEKYWRNPAFRDMLRNTKSLRELSGELFDCIYLAGGHGAMFDFPDNAVLQTLVKNHYENGRTVGAICHGVCGLLDVKLSDDHYLVTGKKITGFAWYEEIIIGREKTVPYNLEAALKERGADYRKTFIPMIPEVVTDGNLITGQDPFSAKETARVIMRRLNKC